MAGWCGHQGRDLLKAVNPWVIMQPVQCVRRYVFFYRACFLERRVEVLPDRKGGVAMTVYEAMMIAIASSMLVVNVIGLIVKIVRKIKK